jgi:hypothetical protein
MIASTCRKFKIISGLKFVRIRENCTKMTGPWFQLVFRTKGDKLTNLLDIAIRKPTETRIKSVPPSTQNFTNTEELLEYYTYIDKNK